MQRAAVPPAPVTPAKLDAGAGIAQTPSPLATPAIHDGKGSDAATNGPNLVPKSSGMLGGNSSVQSVAGTPSPPTAAGGSGTTPSFKRRKKFVAVKRIDPQRTESSGGMVGRAGGKTHSSSSAASAPAGGRRVDKETGPARYFKALFSRPKEYKKKRKKFMVIILEGHLHTKH